MRLTRRTTRRAGFTLLEAVIALAILASFTVVCLQLRAQGLAARARIDESLRTERVMQSLLDEAIAGLLPGREIETNDQGDIARMIWRGERFGARYECVRRRVETTVALPANAAPDSDAPAQPVTGAARVVRYTVRYDGEEASMEWFE